MHKLHISTDMSITLQEIEKKISFTFVFTNTQVLV